MEFLFELNTERSKTALMKASFPEMSRVINVLKKSTNKFDCLLYEMFFIQELRPALNVQSDSIRAKVFK